MATVPVQAVGGIVKAADYNFLVGGSAGQRPSFAAVQNATQNLTTGNNLQIVFQSTIRDTDSGYNNSTGTYTVATSGLWLFTANIGFASNATGVRNNEIFANSVATVVSCSAAVDALGRLCCTVVQLMSAGQTAQVFGFQNSTVTLTTTGTSACAFTGIWLGS